MNKDDLELFERAMGTLGVKPQPKEKPRAKKEDGPAMPTLPDDDLDFDAIMRSSRGPAKLDRPGPTKKAVVPTAPETAAHEPASFDPTRYAATDEERALFAAAMANAPVIEAQGHAVRPSTQSGSEAKGAKKTESLAARIKRRGIEIEAQLDLHGKTRAEAEPRVRAFLEECVQERWEFVAIVCGRGVHSEGGRPVLKPLVTKWLHEDYRAWAVEVIDAPTTLGGIGTLIVRVRLDAVG